jgi:hypothetical protein
MSWTGEETNIGGLDGVAIPWDAEHSIAGGFGNEGVDTIFAGIGRNDVFYSSIPAKAASNT